MKKGYLLMNTGAPGSTQEVDQQRYLKEVSKDHHVTTLPSAIDTIVHGNRASQATTAYKAVWTEHGAPLVHTCKKIRNILRARLDAPVEIGMLYGEPSVMRGMGKLLDQEVDELFVVPMFPQYSVETYQACHDKVSKELRDRKCSIIMRSLAPFYHDPHYIAALAEQLKGITEHVLFNYRGLSLQHLKKPDTHGHCLTSMECCNEPSGAHDTCYRFQCLKTARLVAKAVGRMEDQYSVSFDSQHGALKCIEPYTEDMLKNLAEHGHTKLAVICPSYLCDGVETLQGMAIHGKETFMKAGGNSYRVIPGLNDSKAGIYCLTSVIRNWIDYPEI